MWGSVLGPLLTAAGTFTASLVTRRQHLQAQEIPTTNKLLAIDWPTLFVPTYSIAEMVLRGTITYLALFCILRFVMKRQTGSIGIADILVIVVIADAAQNAFSSQYQSVTEGIVLVLTIVLWDLMIDWLSYRVELLRNLLEPKPIPLIRNGRLLRKNLRLEFLNVEELQGQLRQQGVEHLEDVKLAFLEPDGAISVIRNNKNRPTGKIKTP